MPVDIRMFLDAQFWKDIQKKNAGRRSFRDFIGNATVWTKTSASHNDLIGPHGLRIAVTALADMRARVEKEYSDARDLMHLVSRQDSCYHHTHLYMFGEQ